MLPLIGRVESSFPSYNPKDSTARFADGRASVTSSVVQNCMRQRERSGQATRRKMSYASGSGTPRSCMRDPQCKPHPKGHGQETIISVGPAPEGRIFSSTQRFSSKRSSPGLTQKIKAATLAPPPREGESDICFFVKIHPANSTYKF